MITLCRSCALKAFENWQGVPWKDARRWDRKLQLEHALLPAVPELIEGRCPSCNACRGVEADQIAYLNVHSYFNTGLPDYWSLVVMDNDPEKLAWLHDRFGYPYPEAYRAQAQLRQWKNVQERRTEITAELEAPSSHGSISQRTQPPSREIQKDKSGDTRDGQFSLFEDE